MRTRTTLTLASLGTALSVVAGACTGGGDSSTGRRPVDLGGTQAIAALRPFDDCEAVLSYLRTEAAQRVGPWGIPGLGSYGPFFATGGAVAEDAAAARENEGGAPAGPATTVATEGDASAAGGDEGFSGTNVQEAGVDEPDIVKTDGERIVAVMGGLLHVIDATGATPVLVGSLDLPDEAWGGRLLLDGDRALVLVEQPVFYTFADTPVSDSGGREPGPDGEYTVPRALVVEVDLSDPANPSVTGTLSVEGTIVDARQVGTTARIVVRSTPDALPFVYPSSDNPAAMEAAAEVNRAVVEGSTLEDWLPDYTIERDGTATDGQLVPCEAVHYPEPFSGFATVSVLTVDLAGGLTPGDGTAVVADGQTVYASAENLYVATNRWVDPAAVEDGSDPVFEEDWTTQIHQFSTPAGAPAAYLASGVVDGMLLNSYSMSEHDGALRVATTDGSPWASDGGAGNSESGIVVLARDGEQLVPVGQVRGLGQGEQIYAVRYIGPTAYVVTFRQTDPLYVVDLSDPSSPTVAGELKINGYSAYLHPVGDGLLLGVGQDADDEGRVLGLQVSLFDVSDPASPQRLQQFVVGGGSSDAEYDPHAFLWWAPTSTAVLPMSVWSRVAVPVEGDVAAEIEAREAEARETEAREAEAGEAEASEEGGGTSGSEPAPPPVDEPLPPDAIAESDVFVGALALRATVDGITEIGRLSHAGRAPEVFGPDWPPISRSLVIGDTLYTFSEAGLATADLTTLTESAFVPFPTP